tara:strand:- start:3531 stop:4457 length:927 start_codon:yes stop_codon:yes gene_type:complete
VLLYFSILFNFSTLNMFIQRSSSYFFNQIIDYAGFFPPSQLPIEEAFYNFLDYQYEAHNRMLSRFICPAQHLQTIYDLSIQKDTSNIPIIIVGSVKDIENQIHWMTMHKDILSFSAAETKFDYRKDGLTSVEKIINNDINLNKIFLESDIDLKDFRFISFLDNISKNTSFGLKIRCGGAIAKSVPHVNLLSKLFILCAERAIPLKFTAGLHRAVRHINNYNNIEHGFINVFLGGIAAYSGIKDEIFISSIIECQNKNKFVFSDSGISFENIQIKVADIKKAREKVTSFGSCNFIKPIEDLTNMELIVK